MARPSITQLPPTGLDRFRGLLTRADDLTGGLLAAVPGIGTLAALNRSGNAAQTGDYTKAVESLTDVIPVGRLASNAIRGITRGRSAGDIGGVLNMRAPQQDALDLAQQRAALPKSEGGLGLPSDNTPMQRAKAIGHKIDGFHGTGKVYEETKTNRRGVNFISPDPEFANKYAGAEYSVDIGESPNVIPTMVRSENAFDYENKDHVKRLAQKASLGKLAIDQIKSGDWQRLEDRTTLDAIKRLGFDGLYVNEQGVKNFATFEPSNIRSRFAAFDPFRTQEADLLAIQGGLLGSSTDSRALNQFEYPQQAALDTAQRNAALPVEQGGLGLRPDNTPMERELAMGGKRGVHFSRTGADVTELDSGKYAVSPFDAIGTHIGSKDAANQRFENTSRYSDEPKGVSYEVSMLGNNEFLNKNGQPMTELELIDDMVAKGDWQNKDYKAQNADLRQKYFSQYDRIPYVNDVEDAGNVSYIVPPWNIRSVNAAFDPMRRNEADLLAFRGNMGGTTLGNINPLLGLLDDENQ